MSDIDTFLKDVSPENLANDPVLRRDFIVALLASDFYLPVEESEAEQAERGGISLQAIKIHDISHVLMFSSEARLKAFCPVGTRFARVVGNALFPSLGGQFGILNPGPSGLILTPDDIDEILGRQAKASQSHGSDSGSACGEAGHVHGPDCQH